MKGVRRNANTSDSKESSLLVVALGASAGGLEAFEEFFRHMTADSGFAFVLLSHLDPGHASMLTDILQRATGMKVAEAKNGMQLKPNCVYVIPPNRDMTVVRNTLKLSLPTVSRGQRMPIDLFFRSLAKDQGEKAIGIILSGTGTDGTLGLRDIHSLGGISIVQDPVTAKYDGMPSSAIQSGFVTHILPVAKMPEILLGVLHHQARRHEQPLSKVDPVGLNQILMVLRSSTGHDFSQYKKNTLARRIERRMFQHNIERTEVYVRYLKEFPSEVQLLFREMLINVTSFFRDPEAFLILAKDVLPQLFADKPEDYVFRIWVPGCSSGEEAYSIAILLQEFMEKARQKFKCQIYATDLDEDAIAQARKGRYLTNIAQDVDPNRLRRFFVKEDSAYRVKKEIRDMMVFAVQNIIKDPPFTKLDLLSCRNLMIYLEVGLQNRLVLAFHYALKPGGGLFLSPAESLGIHSALFTPVNRKWKIYRAVRSEESANAVMASGLTWTLHSSGKPPEEVIRKARETNFSELTRRVLLHSYAPAAVVTDLKGEILFVHGDISKYLGLASGQPTLNVLDMAHEGLHLELSSAIRTAAKLRVPTLNRELQVKTHDVFEPVSLSVRPLPDPDTDKVLLLITFQNVGKSTPETPGKGKTGIRKIEKGRIEELEQTLNLTKATLQDTIEEQQFSNEELKSTNEELQSANEELQSTNEELETSKEELQSINEELITVNSELQGKIEQLDSMQNDMKNLLDNINVGAIFLDEQLRIRRFSRAAEKVYNLIPSDVGRPLSDIKSTLANDTLLSDARTVLDSLVPIEHEIATVTGEEVYLARIQPYRTLDNMIQGVVMTFTDITRSTKEAILEKEKELAVDIVNSVREPLVVLNKELSVIVASRSFYREFGIGVEETVGRSIYELIDHRGGIPELQKMLENIINYNESVDDFVIEAELPRAGWRKITVNGRRIVSPRADSQLILLAMELSESGRRDVP
ncbi:MAG: chemotaxis protein CheB [Leptospirillum sp.]